MSRHLHGSYKKTLREAQAELVPLERLASKLIHLGPIWHASTLCEKILFRFIPLVVGYSIALTCGIIFLAVAFIFNYSVRSLHILFLLFVIGYIIGLIVDYVRLLPRRSR